MSYTVPLLDLYPKLEYKLQSRMRDPYIRITWKVISAYRLMHDQKIVGLRDSRKTFRYYPGTVYIHPCKAEGMDRHGIPRGAAMRNG